jgi:Uncharacterised nucleotidyltransferase
MSKARFKRAVLAALRGEPDTAWLGLLPALQSKQGSDLLRWLDQGGLSLLFLQRLQTCAPAPNAADWLGALRPRLERNTKRVQDMLEEFQRLHQALRACGVTAAALKGFTLIPDFCEDPCLRHQVDFDFLIAPTSLRAAAEALHSCGYSSGHLSESRETCFTTPLRHIPSPQDDIYAVQRHRQVDLHVSIWEECSWFSINAPADCLDFAQPGNVHGVPYLGLTLEDKFLMQVFHAFRHSFRSWVRLSWLREIGQFMENHGGNSALWHKIIARSGDTCLTRMVFPFVLGIANRLFGSPIPSQIVSWTSDAMPLSLSVWLDHFAVDWAISDWPGSLNNLFLTDLFIPDRAKRFEYVRGRLFPKSSSTSIGSVAVNSSGMFLRLQAARLSYVTHRAAVHLTDISRLPLQQVRWKRGLQASRRSIVD